MASELIEGEREASEVEAEAERWRALGRRVGEAGRVELGGGTTGAVVCRSSCRVIGNQLGDE